MAFDMRQRASELAVAERAQRRRSAGTSAERATVLETAPATAPGVPDRPCDIPGVPARFTRWRPHQREAVAWVVEQLRAGERFVGLNAPVGSGKSLVAVAVAGVTGQRCLYVVSTRQLQEQLARDFPHAQIIWGRDHYPCIRFGPDQGLTAAACTHHAAPCPRYDACSYKRARQAALASPLTVTNYAFFLTEANIVGGFSGWDLVVLDEGDVAEAELMRFVEVVLTRRQLERCGLQPPDYRQVRSSPRAVEAWREWAAGARDQVGRRLEELNAEVEAYVEADRPPPRGLVVEREAYDRLYGKLARFAREVDRTWVAELDDSERCSCKPTWVGRLGEPMLWRHGRQFLVMSATLLSPGEYRRDLGMPQVMQYHEVPSTFPVGHRPIVYLPVADLGREGLEEAWPALLRTIDALLDHHRGERGIIHTVSTALARRVCQESRHRGRLLFAQGPQRVTALERHRAEGEWVLVSPSFSRGLDLAGDRARFQIIVKLPFPDLRDRQTRARRWSGGTGGAGERWYTLQAVRDIVQAYGRIVRSPEDVGTTYCLDARFQRFFRERRLDWPAWFAEAVQW